MKSYCVPGRSSIKKVQPNSIDRNSRSLRGMEMSIEDVNNNRQTTADQSEQYFHILYLPSNLEFFNS